MSFVVWTLMDDGLRVPPFESHSDGHGKLRAAGLDAKAWLRWSRKVAARMERAQEAFDKTTGLQPGDIDLMRDAAMVRDSRLRDDLRARQRQREQERNDAFQAAEVSAAEVIDAFDGPPVTSGALAEAYARWTNENVEAPPGSERPGERATELPRDAVMRHELFTEFSGAVPKPPRLLVHLVDYPELVVAPIPPTSLVLGGPAHTFGIAERIELLREGFRRLAAGDV